MGHSLQGAVHTENRSMSASLESDRVAASQRIVAKGQHRTLSRHSDRHASAPHQIDQIFWSSGFLLATPRDMLVGTNEDQLVLVAAGHGSASMSSNLSGTHDAMPLRMPSAQTERSKRSNV